MDLVDGLMGWWIDGLMELASSTVTVLRAFKEFSKKIAQSLRICEGVSGGSER